MAIVRPLSRCALSAVLIGTNLCEDGGLDDTAPYC